MRTITRIFADWGTPLLPPTVGKVALLGATLRAGGYRSAAGYLSLYRTHCARADHGFGPELATAARDAARACARGLGGPIRASPLPLDRLHLLSGVRAARVPGGPCSARNAMVVGSWWLLREIELATLRASLVETSIADDGGPVVALTLAASKTDQQAKGVARAHRCRCSSLPAPFSCPAHVVIDQLLFLRRQFPEQWAGDRAHRDLPLFPQISGAACSKAAMVGTIVDAAGQLDVPLASVDGATRISGHSLRVGGAQGLARAGFPTWSIQLMGRWGTDTVKQYIGEAALDVFSRSGAVGGAADQTDLTDFLDAAFRVTDPTDRRRTHRTREAQALSTAAVDARVAEIAGELRHELHEALAQQLRQEIVAQRPAAAPTTDQGTETDRPVPATVWVQNHRTECWHVVSVGPGSGFSSTQWACWCGWAFGRSPGYRLEMPPRDGERCPRCLDISLKRTGRAAE